MPRNDLPVRCKNVREESSRTAMGTVVSKKRKDGSVAFSAQIVIKRSGVIIHRETKTFDRRPAATLWLKKREAELAKPGALDAPKASIIKEPTLAEAIDRYTAESAKTMGKTKAQVLRSIKAYPIAEMPCFEIASEHIVAWARNIKAPPQTVGNYVSHLAAIFAIARPAWGYRLDSQAMQDATVVLRRLGTTAKSAQRDRRPTLDEVNRILEHFTDRQHRRPAMNPMTKLVVFAMFSTRRLEEILRITWTDLDEVHSRILVRDMKNPGDKVGNNVWCDLPEEALKVIRSMPRGEDRIFPFGTDAVSAAFTRAVRVLGIQDLHFHDLRHEGVSRLFELGKNIPQVAVVSGHRSWSSLKRYTHVRQTGDKWAGWKGLDDVIRHLGNPPKNLLLLRKG